MSCCGKSAPVAYSVNKPIAKPIMTQRPLPISFARVQPNTLHGMPPVSTEVCCSSACGVVFSLRGVPISWFPCEAMLTGPEQKGAVGMSHALQACS